MESSLRSPGGVEVAEGNDISGLTDGERERPGCELTARRRREDVLGDETRNAGEEVSVSGAGSDDERLYILAVNGASKRVMTGGMWWRSNS